MLHGAETPRRSRTEKIFMVTMSRGTGSTLRRRCARSCVLAALSLLLLQLAPLYAKPKKSGGGGKEKGSSIKAKLAAKDAEAALERRDVQTAINKLLTATTEDPGYSDYFTQLGAAYRTAGMKLEAAKAYETSISMRDEARNRAGGDQYWASVHVNLGYIYAEGGGQGLYPGAMQKAARAFEQATKILPSFSDAFTYWGNALQEMGHMDQAAKVFQDAISAFVSKGKSKGKSTVGGTVTLTGEKAGMLYFHLANCKGAVGDWKASMKAYLEATKLNPGFAAAYTNLGTIYQGRKMNQEAKQALQKAVQIDGQLAEAYTNLGIALQDLGEGPDAEAMTALAVRLKPEMAAGHNNHGRALEHNNKLEAALSSYRKALTYSGQGYADAFCAKVYLEHFLCAWDTLDADMQQVAVNLEVNLTPEQASAEPCVQPFRAFAYPLPSMLFKNVTVKVVQQERLRLPTKAGVLKLSKGIRELLPSIAAGGKQRLRIGYMSSDFGGHTVGSLIRNLLKLHNRNRCEVAGIGMMKGDGTEWNLEMQASTDKWLSIHEMTDQAAAFAIDALQIHLLIDLNGHSKGARVGVLLRRPAPILVSYLGYPSTSGGVDDILVSDRVSSPPETRHLYTERLLMLPHSYFVNDHRQLYPRPFQEYERTDYGLAEDSVVLCNFGQLYKVQPNLFDAWARIIKKSPKALLWLLKFPKEAVRRLEQQALARGLRKDQLVLSALLPIDSHVAIKALCDLGLDTAMFNGHTTGADTLWTGTPLVSMASEQMRSRAGASMAYALALTTFIARNLDDYQAVALRLASSRPRLRAARRRMEAAIESEPFFDTPLWAKVCLACSRLRIDCRSRFAARLFPSHRESLIETNHGMHRGLSAHGFKCGTPLWPKARCKACIF